MMNLLDPVEVEDAVTTPVAFIVRNSLVQAHRKDLKIQIKANLFTRQTLFPFI